MKPGSGNRRLSTISSSSLHPTLRRWLRGFIPAPMAVRWSERIRSAVGALVGILSTGTMMKMVPGVSTLVPLLVAPMGASAVLLFAVPVSPLARSWLIIGGNLVATTVGVTFVLLVNNPVIVSALTISAAIADMFALCYMRPPSNTVALTAVVGGPTVHALGYRSVLKPVLTQSALLLVGTPVHHTTTGHRHPHTQRLPAAEHPPTAAGFTRADIVAALHRQNELLGIDPEDIEAVLREMQLQAYTRTFQALTCTNIMTTPVITVLANTSIPRALELLCQHGLKTLPIMDKGRRMVGIVTRVSLLGLAPAGMRQTLRRWSSIGALAPPRVTDYMKTRVQAIATGAPMSDLVPMFASTGHHRIPVLGADGRLAGIVTEPDLVGGPYHQTDIEPQTV